MCWVGVKKDIVLLKRKLNDRIINSSQALLRNQFPSLNGLISSLLLPMHPLYHGWKENFL